MLFVRKPWLLAKARSLEINEAQATGIKDKLPPSSKQQDDSTNAIKEVEKETFSTVISVQQSPYVATNAQM